MGWLTTVKENDEDIWEEIDREVEEELRSRDVGDVGDDGDG